MIWHTPLGMNSCTKACLSLALCIIFGTGCFNVAEEKVATYDRWLSPLAPRGDYPLPNTASILEGVDHGLAGVAVSGLGDVDGDGFDDMMIGDSQYLPSTDPERPWCEIPKNVTGYLYYGKAEGLPHEATIEDSADAIFVGDHHQNIYETLVSPAGDVNGDGFADFMVVAPPVLPGVSTCDWLPDQMMGYQRVAYLYYGSPSRFEGLSDLTNAPTKLSGDSGPKALWSVHSAGDLNGDGYDDLAALGGDIVYADDKDITPSGSIYLFYGRPAGFPQQLTLDDAQRVITRDPTDPTVKGYHQFTHVVGVGDVNGDGRDDLLVSQMLHDYYGNVNGDDDDDDADDGDDDDESDSTTEDSVLLILGHVDDCSPAQAISTIADFRFNLHDAVANISAAGDVNGDGYKDFLIGNSGSGEAQGEVKLILGGTRFNPLDQAEPQLFDLVNADATYYSNTFDSAHIGYSLGRAGDINGDGLDDIFFSAFGFDSLRGAAFLIYGRTVFDGEMVALTYADAVLYGVRREMTDGRIIYDNAGMALNGAGDFNGDGHADLLVGAPGFLAPDTFTPPLGAGRVYAVPGGSSE